MKSIGTGALFQDEAKSRFTRLTGSRYDSLCVRLKKKRIPVPFAKRDFREHVLSSIGGKYDGYIQCRYCREYLGIVEIAADHEIPLSRGGSAGLENIGFPCHPCNDRKGSLTPDEYLKLTAFLELEIPLGRQDVLSRLAKAVSLAQNARNSAGVIGDLKKSGAWQATQKARLAAKKARETF